MGVEEDGEEEVRGRWVGQWGGCRGEVGGLPRRSVVVRACHLRAPFVGDPAAGRPPCFRGQVGRDGEGAGKGVGRGCGRERRARRYAQRGGNASRGVGWCAER